MVKMSILDKKYLKEILKAVTKEDEKRFFAAVEYYGKNAHKQVVLGPLYKDNFGNSFDIMPAISYSERFDDLNWNSMKEAKKKLGDGYRLLPLKKGLKAAFNHKMCLMNDDSFMVQPVFVKKYIEWFNEYIAYRNSLMTTEDKESRQDIFNGIGNAINEIIEN